MERRREPRLVEEHLDEVRVTRLVLVDPLEHDVALEALDPRRAREQHVGHPATREVSDELVPTELPLDANCSIQPISKVPCRR
ncbi:MAG: hypothetical protein NT062_10685 [Proteobacteria bacterium]|nr:hypothetical protein [Pseudomonadota bacterium]